MTSIVYLKGDWNKLLFVTNNEMTALQIKENLGKWEKAMKTDPQLSEIEIACVKSDFTEYALKKAIENNIPKRSSFVMIAAKYGDNEKKLMKDIKRPIERYGNYWSIEKFINTSVKKLILEVNDQARGQNYELDDYSLFDGKHVFAHITKLKKAIFYWHNNGTRPDDVIEGCASNYKRAINGIFKTMNKNKIEELKGIFLTFDANEVDHNAIKELQGYTYTKFNIVQDIVTIVRIQSNNKIDTKIGNLSNEEIDEHILRLRNIDPLRETKKSFTELPLTIELANTKKGLSYLKN